MTNRWNVGLPFFENREEAKKFAAAHKHIYVWEPASTYTEANVYGTSYIMGDKFALLIPKIRAEVRRLVVDPYCHVTGYLKACVWTDRQPGETFYAVQRAGFPSLEALDIDD